MILFYLFFILFFLVVRMHLFLSVGLMASDAAVVYSCAAFAAFML